MCAVKRALLDFLRIPFYVLAVIPVLVIRMMGPWILIRIGRIYSSAIGHLSVDIELYLCEREVGISVPHKRHLDCFYHKINNHRFFFCPEISNKQLATLWKRVIRVFPAWFLAPIYKVNRWLPGGEIHELGPFPGEGRDIHNLLECCKIHLQWTPEEEVFGKQSLKEMGIPLNAPFVCLIVRDSAYGNEPEEDLRGYRNANVQNYVLAAEELANRGYFVIRMGAKVKEPIKMTHPHVIDYAMNGMRTDFMDVYLGAHCTFCITTGTGWDAIPSWLFRKPTVFTNLLPLGYMPSFLNQFLTITKRHISVHKGRELSLREIFNSGLCFCTPDIYKSKGIQLIENTPEEIRDVVMEMVERLNSTWQVHEKDEALQRKFLEIFPTRAKTSDNKPLHGKIRARFGAHFLRNNREWLQ